MVTADETKSLDISELAKAQENQNETAKAEKRRMLKRKRRLRITLKIFQLLSSCWMKLWTHGHGFTNCRLEFELESMPDDDLQSLSGFETSLSDSSHDVSHSEHTSWEKNASAEFQSLSGHLDHFCEDTTNLKTTKDDTDYDELDKEPLSRKFKIMTPIPTFPTPTPLCSIPSEHMMKPAPQQESIQEFTDKLFQTTSLSFSPAPLKEPSPPKDLAKGKGVDIEEPVNVLNQAKNLGLPLPHALATFGMTAEDKKRKRNETLKEVFVKELIDVDGTKRNITPPSGVVGKEGIVIREPEAGFFYVNENFDLAFQRESEFYLIVVDMEEDNGIQLFVLQGFTRVQRPKLLYSRPRQSDQKNYGDDQGFLIDRTAGKLRTGC
nr:hypothetical protein [Tanacetum cinerariifolium]